MESTIIFRGVPEIKTSNSRKDVLEHFSKYSPSKLDIILYKLNMQIELTTVVM